MVLWYSNVNIISFVKFIFLWSAILKALILVMAQMISNIKFDLAFEISNVDYPGIHAHIVYNSLFGGLWSHGSLQTASMTSKGKYYLWFEFSSHVHVAARSHFGCSCGHCGLQIASGVANGLRIELIDLNFLHNSAFLASRCLYGLNQRRLIMIHWTACFAAGKNNIKSKISIVVGSVDRRDAINCYLFGNFKQELAGGQFGLLRLSSVALMCGLHACSVLGPSRSFPWLAFMRPMLWPWHQPLTLFICPADYCFFSFYVNFVNGECLTGHPNKLYNFYVFFTISRIILRGYDTHHRLPQPHHSHQNSHPVCCKLLLVKCTSGDQFHR